jgi:hypothetical protein
MSAGGRGMTTIEKLSREVEIANERSLEIKEQLRVVLELLSVTSRNVNLLITAEKARRGELLPGPRT